MKSCIISTFLYNTSFAHKFDPQSITQISSGLLSAHFAFRASGETYFAKCKNSSHDVFEKETNGLRYLQNYTSFSIPEVKEVVQNEECKGIIMEYIQTEPYNRESSILLGQWLSEMHWRKSTSYGWTEDNYIGELPQNNGRCDSWVEFFVNFRMEPLFNNATRLGLLDSSDIAIWRRLQCRLTGLFPAEEPSLLHGDLWSGNALCSNGRPVLIDPACYFGFREMDLAMMHLFGGFDQIVYDAYNECYPLEKDWKERVDLCNIYPLLVHLIMYGRSYYPALIRAMRKYV